MTNKQYVLYLAGCGLLGFLVSRLHSHYRDQRCVEAYGAGSFRVFLSVPGDQACSTPDGIRPFPTQNYLDNYKKEQ